MSSPSPIIAPPKADKIPHKVAFGRVDGENRGADAFTRTRYLDDPYFWMRDDDRKDERVLSHLRLENQYAKQQLGHLEDLRQTLYDEHLSHLKETDDKAPTRYGGYFYYSRTVKGLSYGIFCRKRIVGDERTPLGGGEDVEEEVLLDVNSLAEGKPHCDVGSMKMSPNHKMLAYSVDYSGNEVYDLVVVELSTRVSHTISTRAAKTSSTVVWGDDETLFYLGLDDQLRPYQMWRHKLGHDGEGATTSDDGSSLLFEENNEQFWLSISKSSSGRFVLADSSSSETSEIHFLDAENDVDGTLSIVQPRTYGLRYDVEHDGADGFLIWTNKDGALDSKLMCTTLASPGSAEWRDVIPYDPSVKIASLTVFHRYVVVEGRQGGLTQLWVMDKDPASGKVDGGSMRQLSFDEELYDVGVSTNKEYRSEYVRVFYSSLTTPDRWLDVHMGSAAGGGEERRRVLIKEQPVLNFDPSQYQSKRIHASAPDGTRIPISLVYRKDTFDDGGDDGGDGAAGDRRRPVPTMLYGYGSYEICIDPGFRKLILPYLDRGMLYAIAHVRGGGEMGRAWYEVGGKYLTKRNTFQDFISCAEELVTQRWTKPSMLAAEGRSAGGLLMGNVVNMRPDLFNAVVAGVPFVDLMVTMCDPTIPLTTGEWEEWGNPNEAKFFDYMLSYSPMDNVRPQPYPNILITAGLHDPRVAYWEPAKWAARLREHMTNQGEADVIAKFDLDSGHFSASDRYKYIREKAFDQAFVLDKLGLASVESKSSK